MNLIKKVAVGLMAAALMVSAAACHPKDETAMTIGNVKITSAFYMCALMQADGEGRSKVDEANSSAGDSAETSSSAVDYYSQKVDDTDFTAWVKNRAEEICKEYAAYETRFEEAGLTLDEETQTMIDTYCDMYWNQYGLSLSYGDNGVGFETYKKYFSSQYKADKYFMSIYGPEGTNPVPEEEIKTFFLENYAAAQTLTKSYTTADSSGNSTTMTDEEKTALKEKFEGYAQRLREGESFETIYVEQNSSPLTATEGGAKDPYISILGSEDSGSSSDHFAEVKGMAVGEVKVLEDESSGLTLLVCKNIEDDVYYYENLKDQVLYSLKMEEMKQSITEFGNSLSLDKNNFAIDRFKPNKIKYPNAAA
ncbi:MAG: hypothetical protein HFE86_05115 [Clostridiales bacterium]|nr:hypothetical protein [Clostridiales bacterium]